MVATTRLLVFNAADAVDDAVDVVARYVRDAMSQHVCKALDATTRHPVSNTDVVVEDVAGVQGMFAMPRLAELATTARGYLVPIGNDYLRVSTATLPETRMWSSRCTPRVGAPCCACPQLRLTEGVFACIT